MSRYIPVQSPAGDHKKRTLNGENGTETTVKVIETTSEGDGGERDRKTPRFSEVAGGTAAECTVVCCCCPCSLMRLIILTVFKMPVCLCRKAHRRHLIMKKKKKLALMGPLSGKETDIQKLEKEVRAAMEKQKASGDCDENEEIEAVDLEKEMWDQFVGTGFWRSPSQRSITKS